MKKRLLIIFTILFLVLSARPQAVHFFKCLEVLDGGDVRLDWSSPVDEDAFVSYDIYHTTISNPGNFQLIEVITFYGDTSYIHSPTSANQQQNLYYIVTNQNALPDIISDTLNTIHLTVNNTDPYLAVLDWNAMHVPLLAGSKEYYNIWMHNPLSGFNFVDSTMNTHFEIPVAVCRDTLYFKIEIGNDEGCISVSNIFSAVFEDITPPPMPVLDSVSINPFTGEVLLGWSASPAGDAGGYVVYHVLDDINDTLAFVFGIDNTTYTDSSFDPCLQNRSYALAAFDTCGNISPGSYDLPQRTILLHDVIFDPCTMNNTLSWTEYINMSPALQGYRIFLSVDGGPFGNLATMPSGTTAFVHEGLEPEHAYRYFIRAFSSGNLVTSSSCIRELTTWQYKQPQDNDLENASVFNNELVAISLLPDTYAYVPQLNLYRSASASGPFDLIAELELSGQAVVYYDDESAEVNSQSYYYRSELVDSCGNEVLPSSLMRTILLAGEKESSGINELSWNAFQGWPGGVSGYEIYRTVNDGGTAEKIGDTDNATFTWTDDISALGGEISLLAYQVRAMENGTLNLYSWSNEIYIEYTPNLYLPNAFTPGGRNPVYKPVGAFTDFSDYRLDVYNRWGQLIFTSHEYGLGWDGQYKGKPAPSGVYVCILTYTSEGGDSGTLKSSFVLIR